MNPEPIEDSIDKVRWNTQLILEEVKIAKEVFEVNQKAVKESLDTFNTALCARMDANDKNAQRVTFALIGVIGALIGQKFISTPWYIDLAVILSMFAGTFLLASLVGWWKRFTWPQKATRIAGAALLLTSAITQTFLYEVGIQPAPSWFGPTINIIQTILALALIWAGWAQIPKDKKDC